MITSINTSEKLSLSLDDIIEKEQSSGAGTAARGGRVTYRTAEPASSINQNKRISRSHGLLIQKSSRASPPVRKFGSSSRGGFGGKDRLSTQQQPNGRKRQSPYSLISAEDSALLDTECFSNPDGDVIVRLKETEVVTVKGSTGELSLTSGGWRTLSTFYVITESIRPLGLWLEEAENGSWRVSDGRSYLASFQDKMVVKHSTGNRAQQLARGSVIMQHLQQVKRNLAARLSN